MTNRAVPWGAARFVSTDPRMGSEVVAQTYGEAGSLLAASFVHAVNDRLVARAGSTGLLHPGRVGHIVVVVHYGVVGVDTHGLVQLVLDTHDPHVGVGFLGIAVMGHVGGFQRGVLGDRQFAADAVDVEGASVAGCLAGVAVTRVVGGLVETDQLEGVGELVGTGGADGVGFTAQGVFFHFLVGQGGFQRAADVVQRGAEGIAVFVVGAGVGDVQRLALVHRVGHFNVEAVEVRGGVLDGVVVTLVQTAGGDASQVVHVADLVAEQVERTTGYLERAVETTDLDGAEVAAQTHEGVAGGEVGTAARGASGEVDLLFDLEERLQIRVDGVVAFEAQSRGVARQVGFGVLGAVIQIVDRYVRAAVYGDVGQRNGRDRQCGTNSNRNQLLLHRKTPSFYVTPSCECDDGVCLDGGDYGNPI